MMCCHKVVLSSGTHMFQEVYERMTKDMTASAPSALKIMVVAPPDGNIVTFGAKLLALRKYSSRRLSLCSEG